METLNIYLNTYVPFKKKGTPLFLTNKVESFELAEKLVNDTTLGLELNRTIAKKV